MATQISKLLPTVINTSFTRLTLNLEEISGVRVDHLRLVQVVNEQEVDGARVEASVVRSEVVQVELRVVAFLSLVEHSVDAGDPVGEHDLVDHLTSLLVDLVVVPDDILDHRIRLDLTRKHHGRVLDSRGMNNW